MLQYISSVVGVTSLTLFAIVIIVFRTFYVGKHWRVCETQRQVPLPQIMPYINQEIDKNKKNMTDDTFKK